MWSVQLAVHTLHRPPLLTLQMYFRFRFRFKPTSLASVRNLAPGNVPCTQRRESADQLTETRQLIFKVWSSGNAETGRTQIGAGRQAGGSGQTSMIFFA